jgi:hypothetical protein
MSFNQGSGLSARPRRKRGEQPGIVIVVIDRVIEVAVLLRISKPPRLNIELTSPSETQSALNFLLVFGFPLHSRTGECRGAKASRRLVG